MGDLSAEKLDELEALEKELAETYGPEWEAEFSHTELPFGIDLWWLRTPVVEGSCSELGTEMYEEIAKFIAAARNALPALLAEVRRRRAAPAHPAESEEPRHG